MSRRAHQLPTYPARVHDVPIPGFPRPAAVTSPLEFDPALAAAGPSLLETGEPTFAKIIASRRASFDRELDDAEAGDLVPTGGRGVAGPKHARHGVQKDGGGEFDAVEVARRRQHPVDERGLEASLPRREEVETKAVGGVHPGRAVAAEIPALAGVFPPEDDVHRLLRARVRTRPERDLFRIRHGGPALETAAAGGEGQEEEKPEDAARQRSVHVAAGGEGTAGRVSSCRFTASGNRCGRPRASVHTRAVRARASVASSEARAIR